MIIFSRQGAKTAKVFLGELSVFACMDAGEGREQDAEALRESLLNFDSFVKMLVTQGLLVRFAANCTLPTENFLSTLLFVRVF